VTTLAVAGGVIVLGSILLGISQIRSIVLPLTALHRGITRLGRCDSRVAVDRVGDREFREVAACFNDMAQEILHMKESLEERVKERTEQLVRSERLARLGELAAGFAHEINNPLAIMSSHAELALQHWNSEMSEHEAAQTAREMAGALSVVIDEVDRSQRVVARLVRLGNHAPSASEVLSVREFTQSAIELLSPLAQQAGCRLEYKPRDTSEHAQIVGVENEMLQLLINLLLNAIAATEHEGGVVCVTSEAGRDSVTVRIADDGRGIDPQKIASIFDPFVSSTGSTGLGLSVSHAIATRHGAQLDAASDGPGAGSVFTLEIPRYSKETAA
jgi:two-component system, NtrC family, sensor kinase